MTLPNFLVIGAAKAGTTSLYYYLRQHPQIYLNPVVKETGFFASEGDPLDFQGPGDCDRRLPINNFEDYLNVFEGVKDEIAIGEVCTDYIYHPLAPQRIYHYIPDVKLIVIFRDPAERAYSQFQGNSRDGYEPCKDFAQALKEEKSRIANNWHLRWHYRQRGYYSTQIKRYYELFDQQQIKIYLYEDYFKNPVDFTQQIFRFIGVDDTFIPEMSVKLNVSPKIPKNQQLHKYLTDLKKMLPVGQGIVERLIEFNSYPDKVPLAPEIRQQLIREYREEILKLQDLIGRDLSKWLTVKAD